MVMIFYYTLNHMVFNINLIKLICILNFSRQPPFFKIHYTSVDLYNKNYVLNYVKKIIIRESYTCILFYRHYLCTFLLSYLFLLYRARYYYIIFIYIKLIPDINILYS